MVSNHGLISLRSHLFDFPVWCRTCQDHSFKHAISRFDWQFFQFTLFIWNNTVFRKCGNNFVLFPPLTDLSLVLNPSPALLVFSTPLCLMNDMNVSYCRHTLGYRTSFSCYVIVEHFSFWPQVQFEHFLIPLFPRFIICSLLRNETSSLKCWCYDF